MIYDDLSFMAIPDPRRPHLFKIVAYPPEGFRLHRNSRTGVFNCIPLALRKQAEDPTEQEVEEITGRAESIRAESLEQLRGQKGGIRISEHTCRGCVRTGRVDRETLRAAGAWVGVDAEDLEMVGDGIAFDSKDGD